ncbi:EamA family transporter [Thalassotalea ganghwensis]
MSLKDSLLGVLIIFIWGFNFTVIAWGVTDIPPLLLGALRFLTIALVGSLFIRKPLIPWRWMALYALTLCFGQFAFLFSAMAFGMPAGLASLVLQSQAIFTILFSALMLKEVIKAPQLIAMMVAGAGLAVIGYSQTNSSMTLIGFVFTICAAISWATGNVINRKINQQGYQANIGLVVWSSWVAFIPFLLASVIIETPAGILSALSNITTSAIAVVMYLAFAASILAYSLWSYLLQHYPAGQVAPLTLGVPVVGLMSAAFFLNESLNGMQVYGGLLVMFGLLINSMSGRYTRIFNWFRKHKAASEL